MERGPAESFNSGIAGLITRAEKKVRSKQHLNSLNTIRKRIGLLKMAGVEEPIRLAAPFFVKFSNIIIARVDYEKKIMSADFRKEYSLVMGPANKDEPILELIECLRGIYGNLTPAEKDEIYLAVKNLHDWCLEYQISITPDDI